MESHGEPFSHGRRLFELLEEQQEPFLLEDYLSENGLSCKLLKSQQPSTKCWRTETCRKFLGFSSRGFKGRGGGGELICALPKKWNLKLRKALNWKKNRIPFNGISGLAGFFTAIRGQARSGRFSRLLHSCEEVLDGRRRGKPTADSKQLSPVSVLELHSHEGCSARNHSTEEESSSTSSLNPEAAEEDPHYIQHKSDRNCTPRSKDLLQQCGKEFEERMFVSHESSGHHRAAKAMEVQVISLGAASIAEWIDGDSFGTRTEWSRFPAEATEIGLVIEGFVFDEIREEVVVEMLGSLRFVGRDSF